MSTSNKPQDKVMRGLLSSLKEMIQLGDKQGILDIYEAINTLNFKYISDGILDRYDKLVEQGNNILYT